MKSTTLIFLFLVLTVLPSTLTSAPSNAPIISKFKLTKSDFLVFDKRTAKPTLSASIDFSKHDTYGWRIEFVAPKGKHVVKEVLTLPAPANWGVGSNTIVSVDQRSATTQIPIASKTTKFSAQNLWSYAPGDPTGIYTFDIYIDNALMKTYVINVTN